MNIAIRKIMSDFLSLLKNGARFFYLIIKPKSENEDDRRREFILNILIMGNILLSSSAFLVSLYIVEATGYSSAGRGFSLTFLFFIPVTYIILYALSRNGYFGMASYIFATIYFVPTTYMAFKWGIEVPAVLLLFTLIIIMCGILIGTRFAFVATGIISLILVFFGFLQINQLNVPNYYWKIERVNISDIVLYVFIILIIAVVSWLSNREIERSLLRARKSEAELKKERDMLEIKVEERTKELRETQMEKIQNLHRIAEFGRLSSGIFHDMMNPLTAVSLSLQQMKDEGGEEIAKAKSFLELALTATKRMEDFMSVVKKQMQKQSNKSFFSLNDEILQIVKILSYKSRRAKVSIVFTPGEQIKTYGDRIKFSQIAMNFISNAIDSYDGIISEDERREVRVNLSRKGPSAIFTVRDYGCGIPEENREKIFDPFFTTKDDSRGMGIGLSASKNNIENEFGGKIKIESIVGEGTKFVITMPLTSPPPEN